MVTMAEKKDHLFKAKSLMIKNDKWAQQWANEKCLISRIIYLYRRKNIKLLSILDVDNDQLVKKSVLRLTTHPIDEAIN